MKTRLSLTEQRQVLDLIGNMPIDKALLLLRLLGWTIKVVPGRR